MGYGSAIEGLLNLNERTWDGWVGRGGGAGGGCLFSDVRPEAGSERGKLFISAG